MRGYNVATPTVVGAHLTQKRKCAGRFRESCVTNMLIRGAHPGRDRLMLDVAYFGGLRVSELAA
jgi:site-specific recombinase XerD